jgi:hypothetical protein
LRPEGGCYETRRKGIGSRRLLQKSVCWCFSRTQALLLDSMLFMQLPSVGTSELLRVLSPYIPDDFVNERFARRRREGRRARFSPAQLWRVHLLVLLTRTFSFNALIRCLPEQEQWRRFAHLPNRFAIPDVRMLNDFRRSLGAGGFRHINDHLLWELLSDAPLNEGTVAFIDATDLPARAEDKKNKRETGRRFEPRWERAHADQVKPVSSWATKNTRCAFGSAAIRPRSCLRPWSLGQRPRMCPRGICLSLVSGTAENDFIGGRRLS